MGTDSRPEEHKRSIYQTEGHEMRQFGVDCKIAKYIVASGQKRPFTRENIYGRDKKCVYISKTAGNVAILTKYVAATDKMFV